MGVGGGPFVNNTPLHPQIRQIRCFAWGEGRGICLRAVRHAGKSAAVPLKLKSASTPRFWRLRSTEALSGGTLAVF